MRLDLATDLQIDFDESPYKTQGLVLFICGMRGSGKSYTLVKTFEQCYRNGLQFVFLDPHGEGHVLADKSFAKHGGIVVASERYGVPIDSRAIPIYVDLLKQGSSMVLDLSKFFAKSKSRFNQFAEEFIRHFYAEWSDIRRPIFLGMDEAHYFAPQRMSSDSVSRTELVEELSTGGRKFGIHLGLSTQRPALISKTPISQANLRLFGKIEIKQDWDAIKEFVSDAVDYKQVRALSSGQFIVSLEGSSRIVQIAKRETVDAGATPDANTSFSKTVEIEIGDIAERIRTAIADTETKQEREQALATENKALQTRNESLKEQMDRLQERFETLDFISKRMIGKGAPPAGDTVEREKVQEKIRLLKTQFKSELAEKSLETDRLRHQLKGFEDDMQKVTQLRVALLEFIGPQSSGNGETDTDSLVEEVTNRVMAAMPIGGPVTLAPLEALKTEWEQRALQSMISQIDGFPTRSIQLLAFLVAQDRFVTKGAAANAIFGHSGGSGYQQLNEALAPLLTAEIAENNQKQGLRPIVDSFIRRNLGSDNKDDIAQLREHVLARIHYRINGGVE